MGVSAIGDECPNRRDFDQEDSVLIHGNLGYSSPNPIKRMMLIIHLVYLHTMCIYACICIYIYIIILLCLYDFTYDRVGCKKNTPMIFPFNIP